MLTNEQYPLDVPYQLKMTTLPKVITKAMYHTCTCAQLVTGEVRE